MREIVHETSIQAEAAQVIADKLENAGLVTSVVLQVGTGGTCERFYKPVVGVSVKILGPPALNKF